MQISSKASHSLRTADLARCLQLNKNSVFLIERRTKTLTRPVRIDRTTFSLDARMQTLPLFHDVVMANEMDRQCLLWHHYSVLNGACQGDAG